MISEQDVAIREIDDEYGVMSDTSNTDIDSDDEM